MFVVDALLWSGNINNAQLKLRIREILLTEDFQTSTAIISQSATLPHFQFLNMAAHKNRRTCIVHTRGVAKTHLHG